MEELKREGRERGEPRGVVRNRDREIWSKKEWKEYSSTGGVEGS